MTKQSFAAATLVSLFVINLTIYAADLEQPCKILLNQTLPVWTMASISEEVKTFTAEQQADPLRIRGDFDGDGRQDIALLIQNRARPVFEEPDRIKATRIAVCLAKEPLMVQRLIEEPYCDDFIYLVKKGEDMYAHRRSQQFLFDRRVKFPVLGTRTDIVANNPLELIAFPSKNCFPSCGARHWPCGRNFQRDAIILDFYWYVKHRTPRPYCVIIDRTGAIALVYHLPYLAVYAIL